MLRFYSYFKQATEGPCDKPKPGFWDVVNRAKWESWNKLGNMAQEEAMQAYVDELHKIVETMSYSADVASFLSVDDDGDGDEFPNRDLELVAGDVLKRARSQHNSPSGSRSASGASSPAPAPRARHDSEDEYIDTVDLPGTLARLEADVAALRKAVEGERMMHSKQGWRWPWQELSPPTLLVLVVWPFLAYKLAARLQRRNT
ncbi:hypothetical protein MSG28_015031 [Choristoneura fumiferana]|uniref:Uncharacterized protein n=3 Tax=Choristoneura fumiferana TaxID=7141 RepID=A0ACC0KYL2_CHOFU|nr:hypothetical protein MSG28_015031 [Choristoneura fumiferana]KAI8441427.1 hypothetical protein MSG28_015031 [Choristoneura fumiferana]KAI8441429.1 hypothetical protein MSG28_015031 [Choristoneura fumiferana]